MTRRDRWTQDRNSADADPPPVVFVTKRERKAIRGVGLVLLGLAAIYLWMIVTARKCEAQERTIPVDTTPIVLRVMNYQPGTVMVRLLLPGDSVRYRISALQGGHEGLFFLPSREVQGIVAFFILVTSDDPTIRPYKTGLITRNTAKITIVVVVVGKDALPDSARRAVPA